MLLYVLCYFSVMCVKYEMVCKYEYMNIFFVLNNICCLYYFVYLNVVKVFDFFGYVYILFRSWIIVNGMKRLVCRFRNKIGFVYFNKKMFYFIILLMM